MAKQRRPHKIGPGISPSESGKNKRTRKEVYGTESCNLAVGGKVIWMRKKRRDGSTYSLRIMKGGKQCGAEATRTICREGKIIRRCREHLTEQ